MKLFLFDIDGTILLTHGMGRRAVEQSLSALCGRTISTKGTVFSGKTDPQILREVLVTSGLSEAEAERVLPEATAAYAEAMQTLFEPERVELLPGVDKLVAQLHEEPGVQLGLVTGNLEPLAYLKLAAVGLDRYFPFGAFGSDHASRPELPAIAVARARAFAGRDFSGKDVVIIGDTEHDITCGRSIGAYAVGVCTGNYRRHELQPHAPDLLLDDLTDLEAFLSLVARRAA